MKNNNLNNKLNGSVSLNYRKISAIVILLSSFMVNAEVTFEDITVAAGITGDNCSWGTAWGDYDGDGFLDVYTTTHVKRKPDVETLDHLYKNNGDLTFTDVSTQAGIKGVNVDPHSVAWVDVNNDGLEDVFVHHGTLKDGENAEEDYNLLYENQGNGTFINIASTAGVEGVGVRGRGVAWGDYDLDGDLDMFGPGEWTIEKGGEGSFLFKNNGDGTFTDVAGEAGVKRQETNLPSWAAGWLDLNNDGWPDLIVLDPEATPTVTIYLNNQDSTFTDATTGSGIEQLQSIQGAAFGDYDNDSDLDLYVNSDDDAIGGTLFNNNGQGHFTDVSTATGVNFTRSGRGADWADYDNDGNLDLYIVSYDFDTYPHILYKNNGDGTFSDVTADAGVEGLGEEHDTKAGDAMFVDINNDGALDLFITHGLGACVNNEGPFLLYKSSGVTNNWLNIKLRGSSSNLNGIGAKVTVKNRKRTQFREKSGWHYMSQDSKPLHFGLGRSTIVQRVDVEWPSGLKSRISNVLANQTIEIVEPLN